MIAAITFGLMLWQAQVNHRSQAGPPGKGPAEMAESVTPVDRGAGKDSGSKPAPSLTPALSDYRIGPEDVLQIDVWKESDFSATAPVRADGKISVPLLSDVQAAGLTPVQLAARLREQLSQYIVDPKITVTVTQMNSRKAYVMGQVNRQGIVRLQSNLTVLQAISAAGGLAPFANGKKIYVLRSRDGQPVRLPFNYDAVIKGKRADQNIALEPGDTVVVP